MNKVAPAIAAGCTVVIKPSPLASITTVMLGELSAEAGVPAGVLNIVTGGPPAGSPASSVALADHPLLDKLSFTGSSATGEKLLHASAARLRPTSLELGGKGAIVVFEDADLSFGLWPREDSVTLPNGAERRLLQQWTSLSRVFTEGGLSRGPVCTF